MLTHELFPLPDGPTSAVTFPGDRLKETFCKEHGHKAGPLAHSDALVSEAPGTLPSLPHCRRPQKALLSRP